MSIAELAERLKKARESRGINQQSAAEYLNIPRTAISQIESGNRAVSTLELTQFAKLYHYSISYFLDEMLMQEEELDVLLYRDAPQLNQATQKHIFHYVDLCKQGIALEKILDFERRSNLPQYGIAFPKNKGVAAQQGAEIAEQERKRLNIGMDSIADIASLISSQGIWACSADFPDDVSGFFFNSVKSGLIILVNSSHVKSRKRFSYAHEYAHALFDRDKNIRISSSENNSELIEIRANAFAAAFLMPTEGVYRILHNLNKGRSSRQNQIIFDAAANTPITVENRESPYSQDITFQDISIIAHHFGVSYNTAVYRLRSMHIISQQECEKLVAKNKEGRHFLLSLNMFSDFEEKEDKRLWDRELIMEISRLAVEAFRRKEISRGKVIEIGDMLGVGGHTLYEFALSALDTGQSNR